MNFIRAIVAGIGPLLLCSCATLHPLRPADVTMNPNAGRGDDIVVTLRLESGEELPMVVDTGSPITFFNQSLAPKLGKRLDTGTFWSFGSKGETSLHAAPRLYLGNTLLLTGRRVGIVDFRQLPMLSQLPDSVKGVLGMDCLRHYCIQLDFGARKMRFLDTDHLNRAELGKAFPLTFSGGCPSIHHGGLMEEESTNLLIDTGDNLDGFLNPLAFWRAVREEVVISTNPAAGDQGNLHHNAFFPEGIWDGRTYTNLVVQEQPGPGPGLIGLRFLARHLVTLDFPGRTLYLKQTSIGPLAGDTFRQKIEDTIGEPAEFVEGLKAGGGLPGWSKNDPGRLHCVYHATGNSNSLTFNFRKNDDPSVYHYQVTRAAEGRPWKLEKAWRTDASNRAVEDYRVP